MKLKLLVLVILYLFFLPKLTFAQTNNYISIVNPIRGNDFWSIKNQRVEDAVLGQEKILDKYSVPATWLLRFDALSNNSIVKSLINRKKDEEGLFLEVTPSLTSSAGVKYHKSSSWHSAASAFLSGYSPSDRIKLIDSAFSKFKTAFGFYPKSVGAWWVDSYSLQYMQQKYGVSSCMIVADQYSTDNYQIWGQYWGTPYYPDKNNNLIPAQDSNSKVPVVITQWASRDPVNGYGNGVMESTYSLQANDYINYHGLTTAYFDKLVDLYMNQPFNKFNQLTVGLENSYLWSKYKNEYQNQIDSLAQREDEGKLNLTTMNSFSNWYIKNFPNTSPAQIIIAGDPLGTNKKTVWFMDNYYRAGWFYDSNGSNFRDIRQYINGSPELCLNEACNSLNFATSATRVLDDVSFNEKWIIDQGLISNFKVTSTDSNFTISYNNEANKNQTITFLPRDLSVDGVNQTIDVAILNALKKPQVAPKTLYPSNTKGLLKTSIFSEIFNLFKYIVFLVFVVFIPGDLLLKKALSKDDNKNIFLSMVLGIVLLTFLSFILGFFKAWWLLWIYSLVFTVIYFKTSAYKSIEKPKIIKSTLIIIILGSIFQIIPTLKSGLFYDFGIGYWGPNTHDGIWHIALANQILQGVFPQNPIFAGIQLKNYHYFFDLLLSISSYLTNISVEDLLFRFYPLLISLLIGYGSYILVKKLFNNGKGATLSLLFIYFAGSFGWIVEYLKNRSLGGESDFWANQSISLNLNPPFAISLVILLAVLEILFIFEKQKNKLLMTIFILLVGTLVEFKSYAGILALGSLGVIAVYDLIKLRSFFYTKLFFLSTILAIIIFVPNITFQQFFIFSPFWLINSMIDFSDRVGWLRLSTARVAYEHTNNWIKFIIVELIGFILFLVGNLGMRILGLLELLKLRKDITPLKIYLYSILFLSFFIPLIFIQVGTGWNIIQFFYYFMFIIALFAGVGLNQLLKVIPRSFAIFVLIIVAILIPINSVTTALTYFGNKPHAFISNGEYQALEFLLKQPEGTVLTYPYDSALTDQVADPRPLFAYDSTAYVSAYSRKSSYVDDYSQNDILQTNYLPRVIASKDFFTIDDTAARVAFLRENKIKYIYLQKYFLFPIDESSVNIKSVFEDSDAKVYVVKS